MQRSKTAFGDGNRLLQHDQSVRAGAMVDEGGARVVKNAGVDGLVRSIQFGRERPRHLPQRLGPRDVPDREQIECTPADTVSNLLAYNGVGKKRLEPVFQVRRRVL